MKLYCRVTSEGLIPLYDSDLEEKKKLKIGTDVLLEVKKARNIRNHKRYFAMLTLVLDNLTDTVKNRYGIYHTDGFLKQIKEDLGLFNITPGGVKDYISISFDEMDEFTFRRFFNLSVKLIISKYLPVTREDIEEEIYKFM